MLFVIGRMTLNVLLSNSRKRGILCKLRGKPGHQLGTLFCKESFIYRQEMWRCSSGAVLPFTKPLFLLKKEVCVVILHDAVGPTPQMTDRTEDTQKVSGSYCWFLMFLPTNYQLYTLNVTLCCCHLWSRRHERIFNNTKTQK